VRTKYGDEDTLSRRDWSGTLGTLEAQTTSAAENSRVNRGEQER